MKAIPPLRARAIAIPWSETACMIAELKGMLSLREGSLPREKRTRGVESDTEAVVHSFSVRLGIRRYSLNVLDGSG
jgi:hypothetical protein